MDQRNLLPAWVVLGITCTALMAVMPGRETIPYHIGWFGYAVAYGFGPWTPRITLATLATYTVSTGAVLVLRVHSGVIDGQELYEIPLMCMLVAMMVWHVRRRHSMMLALGSVMARERRQSRMRERLSCVTSHEMRTPLTIAGGYVDNLLMDEPDPTRREDLLVVQDELGRLARGSERLLRMMHLQDQTAVQVIELDRMLRDLAERWAAVADRQWAVQCEVATIRFSEERVRSCLDTLIENALRYTQPGDAIRILATSHGDAVLLGVADSGRGLDPMISAAINRADPLDLSADFLLRDPRSQTGLGLSLVQEVARSRGGRVLTGQAAEGGALVVLLVAVEATSDSTHEALVGSAPGLAGLPA